MKEQSFELALEEARTGTIDARKNRDLRGQLSFLSLQLSAFVSLGEFKKALDIQSVMQQLREVLLDSENKSAIEGLQAEIELVRQSRTLEKLEESKQLALAQAERENLQTTLFCFGGVAFPYFSIAYLNLSQQRLHILKCWPWFAPYLCELTLAFGKFVLCGDSAFALSL